MTSSNTLPHGINSVPIVSPRNTSIPHPLPHHITGKNHGNLIYLSNLIIHNMENSLRKQKRIIFTRLIGHIRYLCLSSDIREFLLIGFHSLILFFFFFLFFTTEVAGNGGTLRRVPPEIVANEIITKPHAKIISPSKTVTSPHKILAKDMEDLIHLQGPLTEDAVMRTLQARFNEHKYFVSNCLAICSKHKIIITSFGRSSFRRFSFFENEKNNTVEEKIQFHSLIFFFVHKFKWVT